MEDYLPDVTDKISRDLLPQILIHFSEAAAIIQKASSLSKAGDNLTANILLMTAIENIIRRFFTGLALVQNLTTDMSSAVALIGTKVSMESVISRTVWINDVSIPLIELYTKYNYVLTPEVEQAKSIIHTSRVTRRRFETYMNRLSELLNYFGEVERSQVAQQEIDETFSSLKSIIENLEDSTAMRVLIGPKVFFHFLIRRFKDDRNCLMHGTFTGVKERWKTFIYLSALELSWGIVEMYIRKYLDLSSNLKNQ